MSYVFLFSLLLCLQCESTKLETMGEEAASQKIQNTYQKKNWPQVIDEIESYRVAYPYSAQLSTLIFLEAEAYFQNGQYLEASFTYQEFLNKFPYDQRNVQALYQIAHSYDRLAPQSHECDQQHTLTAMDAYQSFLITYPKAETSQSAQGRLKVLSRRYLKSLLFKTALYAKRKKYSSLILVSERILAHHKQNLLTEEEKEIYQKLSEAYAHLTKIKRDNPHQKDNQLISLLSADEMAERSLFYEKKLKNFKKILN